MTPSKFQTTLSQTRWSPVNSKYYPNENGFTNDISSSDDDDDDMLVNSDYSSDSSNSSDNEANGAGETKIMAVNGWPKISNPKLTYITKNVANNMGKSRENSGEGRKEENGSCSQKRIRFTEPEDCKPLSPVSKVNTPESPKRVQENGSSKQRTTITIRSVGAKASGSCEAASRPEETKRNGSHTGKQLYLKGPSPVTKIRIKSVKRASSPAEEAVGGPDGPTAPGLTSADKGVLVDKENLPKPTFWSQITDSNNKLECNGESILTEKNCGSNENKNPVLDSSLNGECLAQQDNRGSPIRRSTIGASKRGMNRPWSMGGLGAEGYSNTLRLASERMFGLVGRKVPAETDTWNRRSLTFEVKAVQQKRAGCQSAENSLHASASLSCESEERAIGPSTECEEPGESDDEEWPAPPSNEELYSKSDEMDGDDKVEGDTDQEYTADERRTSSLDQNNNRETQVFDDDSCVLCDILSNEKRLARRSADMESFRRSTLYDCDTVLKKMEKAQKVVRKLSGNGGSLKALARKSFTEKDYADILLRKDDSYEGSNSKESLPVEQSISSGDMGYNESSPREKTANARRTQPGDGMQPTWSGVTFEAPRAGRGVGQQKNGTGHLYDGNAMNNSEKPSSKRAPDTQGFKVAEEIQAAARRHCKEIIDAEGYLIPQQKKTKSRPKPRRNLSEDFLIVETMPSLQTMEPWRRKSSPRVKEQEMQGYRPGSVGPGSFHSNSLPRSGKSLVNYNEVTSKGLVNNRSPNEGNFGSQSIRLQNPNSQIASANSPGFEAGNPDRSRVEREKSWLKKAARRLRRSLSFEEKSSPSESKTNFFQQGTKLQRRSSGSLVTSSESSRQDGTDKKDGARKRFAIQSLRGSKKSPTQKEGGFPPRNDPSFHPKYGYASGGVGNGMPAVSPTSDDDVFTGNGVNFQSVHKTGHAMNGSATSPDTAPLVHGAHRDSGTSLLGHRQNGEVASQGERFIAPLEVQNSARRTASTKRLQQRP